MAFEINYNAGGVIDEVKKINLPEHLFPSGNTPKIKGLRLDIPAIGGEYSVVYKTTCKINLMDVSVACSGYHDLDFWEVFVGDTNICETMFTKELPENISQGNAVKVAFNVETDTDIKFVFTNSSGTSKKVWITLRYLYNK